MNDYKEYESPLETKYASKEMKYIFSNDKKYTTWRKLWVALAESEKELGLTQNEKEVITQDMIDEMKTHIYDIDYDEALEFEKKFHHDVMGHIHAYSKACPKAAPIIHLGATSAYVTDNTDIIVMKEALLLIKKKLINVIKILSDFADKYKNVETLSYTHFQAAQPTTLGKRATLWLQDFYFDLLDLNYVLSSLKLLGSKGTTGTQASFVKLFNDKDAAKKLDLLIAKKMSFDDTYPVSGQTYSRKIDQRVYSILSSIASSMTKFSNDIRLLSHLKEVEEPFESTQVGSSAMPYKRNPILSERIASLSRYVISNSLNTMLTASSQWLERTLDDSANKRITISEGFLACDSALDLTIYVSKGLIVNEKVIKKNIENELPFFITENILMDLVKDGGNRQILHEEIRKLSLESSLRIKQEGLDNDLIDRLLSSKVLNISKEKMNEYTSIGQYIGRSKEQVTEFLNNYIFPVLKDNEDLIGMDVKIER
ncbi:MAG: adenylosuccinate lyase [Gammaproteobacteria bacterium]|nr:adenylosuccinate lyase [Gammaproteobacteria bacterium]